MPANVNIERLAQQKTRITEIHLPPIPDVPASLLKFPGVKEWNQQLKLMRERDQEQLYRALLNKGGETETAVVNGTPGEKGDKGDPGEDGEDGEQGPPGTDGAAGGAPSSATYIVQVPDATLTNEQALSLLTTGLLKGTTGTGVVSIAAAGTDYQTPLVAGTDYENPLTFTGPLIRLVDAISIPVADTTTDGYLSSTDWNTFNDKPSSAATYIVQTPDGTLSNEQALSALATGILKSTTTTGVLSIATAGTDYESPLTFSLPLSRAINAISITQANGSTDGFLDSGDWTIFNSKQDALPVSDATAIVKGSVTANKLLRFEIDGFTAATTRVLTPQNADYTIAGLETIQTFTVAQTFSSLISNADGSPVAPSYTFTSDLTSGIYYDAWLVAVGISVGGSVRVLLEVASTTIGTDFIVLGSATIGALTGVIIGTAGVLSAVADLPFSSLAQGSALSVLGVTGNATADNASIAAASDHQVLRRSGTAVDFGSINLAQSAAVTGILGVANGGSGTSTAFTAGSVIFAGAAGVYSQDNAGLFWNDASNRLGIGAVTTSSHGTCTVARTQSNSALAAADAHILVRNPSGSQSMLIFATGAGDTIRGGVRSDSSGNFNWHASGSQGHQFYGSNTVSDTNVVAGFSLSGMVVGGIAGSVSVARFDVTTRATTNIGVIIRALASHTVNLLEIHSSASAVMASFGPRGDLSVTPALASSGNPTHILLTGAAHTNLTTTAETIDVNFNLARTVQHATGAIATQRAMLVQAPTYGFVGASTITTAATLAITAAPTAGTNATITNAYALWVQAGISKLDGKVVLNDTIRLKGYTVATLPAGTQGDVAFVTDALAPAFLAAVVGGGAIVTPCFYDGAAWIAG